ncbi:MAG: hypothetical protein E6Q88_02775 [Lysobacteraceae bacterium]|nr:MAG: hypothetical protein E6Q88_02775 [Xanthomonadaceae bacterium]
MSHVVALCGLTAKDSRLLETVINRAASGRHQFQAVQAENAQSPKIAIVDASSPVSLGLYEELRRRHPQLISVTISDHGMAGDTRYRIERRSLFLQVMRVLEDLAQHEFTGTKVTVHPTLTAKTQNAGPSAASLSAPREAAFVTDRRPAAATQRAGSGRQPHRARADARSPGATGNHL